MHVFYELNLLSVALRLVLAILLGGILGFERGLKNRPAGMRTYILVCLGAALIMMTGQFAFELWDVSDPVRMGAQVVSGIGFLGAGTIIVTGKQQLRGLTTAAGIWCSACCGLAVGIGFYSGALATGLLSLLVLTLLERLDRMLRHRSRVMDIFMEFDLNMQFSEFSKFVNQHEIEISGLMIQQFSSTLSTARSITFTATLPGHIRHNDVLELFSQAPGVLYIEELN